jgi:GDP-L-fucose synthase
LKILVTGGSGFIGRNLTEYLTHRHDVLAPSHQELELLDEEMVRSYLAKHRVEIVIHGAVRPGHRNSKDPSQQLYNNTRMFFNLVRNADFFKKMIFLGSGAVYDNRAYQPKMAESYFDTTVPADEHGFSKYIIAKYIGQVQNITELRLFGVFGKYEDYAIRFISNMICKALFDLSLTMHQNRRFDYLFIEDLMPVIDYIITTDNLQYKSYNVTPDETVELQWIAESVRRISGKDLPLIISQEGLGIEYSGSNHRLRNEMPNLSFTPILQAVVKLFEWYQTHQNMISKEQLIGDK